MKYKNNIYNLSEVNEENERVRILRNRLEKIIN